MILAIEQLRELVKSFTIASTVANASNDKDDLAYADSLLKSINQLRLQLAIEAEMREIFWEQVQIPQAGNANSVQNQWFTKTDRAWLLKRGISNFDLGVNVSLLNQGERQRTITREQVAWQTLFSACQYTGTSKGSNVPFDLPETLRFGENAALNIAVQGQTSAIGYLFLGGACLKDNLEDAAINDLRNEFIDPQTGETIYLPETQLIPLLFQFPLGNVDEYATDPNGNENIYSVKSEKSVLLTRISASATDFRINRLSDDGRNLMLCERIECEGVASDMTNPYTTWYDLPFPHLLRRGDRLRLIAQNGSVMQGNQKINAGVLTYLTFEGITL